MHKDDVSEIGIPASDLNDDDLLRELAHLHETRHEIFLHAPTTALQNHSERLGAMELEYLRRHPGRDVRERNPD